MSSLIFKSDICWLFLWLVTSLEAQLTCLQKKRNEKSRARVSTTYLSPYLWRVLTGFMVQAAKKKRREKEEAEGREQVSPFILAVQVSS